MPNNNYTWNSNRLACIATYAILGGDNFLDQFDEFFLGIDKAGYVKLSSLPYFPKFEASEYDIEGRADQMARKFFKYVVKTYTNRKENPSDSVETCVTEMRNLFKSRTATFVDIAEVTDRFFIFNDE